MSKKNWIYAASSTLYSYGYAYTDVHYICSTYTRIVRSIAKMLFILTKYIYAYIRMILVYRISEFNTT